MVSCLGFDLFTSCCEGEIRQWKCDSVRFVSSQSGESEAS